jgi:hypothetical protein
MDFHVTFYDTAKYENICAIFKLYKPPVSQVPAVQARHRALIGGEKEILFMVCSVAGKL